jgi:CysZ protein
MISAAFKALGDLTSPPFRSVLLKAILMALGLFVLVLVLVEGLINWVAHFPWPWAEAMASVGAGLLLLLAFFFLMSPVVALFAGLFLDDIAHRVEVSHYPSDPPGVSLPTPRAMLWALQFALVVLLVNLAVLPLVFTGFGVLALVVANAYLLSREYFEMVATRHMPVDEARQLRKENTPQIFLAGFVPALLSLVPLVNLLVPLFSTSYFVHIFKQVRASSA